MPHTTLVRKKHGEQITWFDPEFGYACSDADFLARLGQLGPVVYLREIVSYYHRGHQALWSDDLKTAVSRFQLWDKHLRLLGDDKKDLRVRLQTHIKMALEKIAMYTSRGFSLNDPSYENFIERGLAHLGRKDRFLYNCFANVSLPVKNFMIKHV